MNSAPSEQPVQPTPAKRSQPVVREPDTSDAGAHPPQHAAGEEGQPHEEPGYGHGV